MRSPLRAALLAGAAAGAVAGLGFAVLHTLIVVRFWPMFAIAPAAGAVAGVALGWADHELARPGSRMPRGRARGVLLGLLAWSALTPLYLTALVAGPVPEGFEGPPSALPVAAALTVAAAALAGLLVGRHWRPALALALFAGLLVVGLGAQTLYSGGLGKGGLFFLTWPLAFAAGGAAYTAARARLTRNP